MNQVGSRVTWKDSIQKTKLASCGWTSWDMKTISINQHLHKHWVQGMEVEDANHNKGINYYLPKFFFCFRFFCKYKIWAIVLRNKFPNNLCLLTCICLWRIYIYTHTKLGITFMKVWSIQFKGHYIIIEVDTVFSLFQYTTFNFFFFHTMS